MEYIWIQLSGSPRPVQIKVTKKFNVDGLIKLIKAEFTPKLDTVALDDINVHTTSEEPSLDPGLDISDIKKQTGYMINTSKSPLVVKTTTLPGSRTSSEGSIAVQQQNLRAFRQQRYKTMSVEASCRKYLDAIATKLLKNYDFDCRYKENATIGDIFAAKDGVEGIHWDIRRARTTHFQTDQDNFTIEIRKGQPVTKVRLPDVYTPEEWISISRFNKETTERVHDGQLPRLQNGKPYIVIPHSEFTPEMIAFLKIIGVKANLFARLDDLVVKDEDALSESSSVI